MNQALLLLLSCGLIAVVSAVIYSGLKQQPREIKKNMQNHYAIFSITSIQGT